MSLKNKFNLNPVENFCKIDENLNFDLFCPYLGSKMIPKYDPWVPIFYSLLRVVPVLCESSGNFLQNRRKPVFWPILVLFGVEKGPPKYDPGAHILQTSKGSSSELKNVCESSGNLL